ncbi:hypothetical protein LTR37_008771 [Vermiconidia calcicola]|uniref:Uncharacterized protein n=1 Tax=Vermiconidia calcicola TaxID=1690605 RepID=A0ACC3NBA2_9PEZI|nr:hypothetical protein LTR37_008771 [Vermiconidia calcicola]
MEKQPFYAGTNGAHTQTQPRNRGSRASWTAVIGLIVFAIWTLRPAQGTWFPLNDRPEGVDTETGVSAWDEITPKTTLEYVNCYGGDFKCARLQLPMDYWNGTTDANVSIAVIKKPAVVPVTHPQYGGAILFNPGGPGGSGVGLLQGAWVGFRGIIDSDNGKYFDLMSFDPRGIANSKPLMQCFDDPLLEQSWLVRTMEEGLFSASDAAFGRHWSIAAARGKSCALSHVNGEPDSKKYMSTASVARDMLEIVERHGEWREKEAKRISRQDRCHQKHNEEVLEALRYRPGEEKINYWGFSYGSYLGNTFAAMFPKRINRLIVDGVVDAYDYKRTLWFDNLVDTEKDLGLFYYHCARVGYPTCALANDTGTTTEEGVKSRLKNIIDNLYHNPLPVISSSPEIITYSDVKMLIFGALYSPLGFPYMAETLRDIEQGNGSQFAYYLRFLHSFTCEERDVSIIQGDATMGVACSDGDDQSWMTKEDFGEHLKNVTTLSPLFGEIWSSLRLKCIHYDLRPNHRFEGPWVGNTSHPILEIGNSADPVTPGRYAKKMARGFTGAVALIQDSAGHCSLSTPSICTQAYVRQYFQTGELPPEDTLCKADVMPFGPTPGEDEIHDEEVVKATQRQETIAAALYAAGGGFVNNVHGNRMRVAGSFGTVG